MSKLTVDSESIIVEMERWSKDWSNIDQGSGTLRIDDLIAHMREWLEVDEVSA